MLPPAAAVQRGECAGDADYEWLQRQGQAQLAASIPDWDPVRRPTGRWKAWEATHLKLQVRFNFDLADGTPGHFARLLHAEIARGLLTWLAYVDNLVRTQATMSLCVHRFMHTQASRARATSSLLAQTNAPFEIRPFQLSSADEKLLYALSSYGENRITEFTLYNLFVLTKLAPAESRCAHAARGARSPARRAQPPRRSARSFARDATGASGPSRFAQPPSDRTSSAARISRAPLLISLRN
mgnify:CR=1 FL=1